MSKQQVLTLGDVMKEAGAIAASGALLVGGMAATVAVGAFCVVVYAPYTAVRQAVEQRYRPIQLRSSR